MKFKNRQTNTIVDAQALTEDNGWDLEDWCGGKFSAFSGVYYFEIQNDKVKSRAELGDYIVQNSDGHFSVIVQDEFDKNFEKV